MMSAVPINKRRSCSSEHEWPRIAHARCPWTSKPRWGIYSVSHHAPKERMIHSHALQWPVLSGPR